MDQCLDECFVLVERLMDVDQQSLREKAQDIFHRLSEDTYDDVAAEYLQLAVAETDEIKAVVDVIFEALMERPSLWPVFANFCVDVTQEQVMESAKAKSFRDFLSAKFAEVTRMCLQHDYEFHLWLGVSRKVDSVALRKQHQREFAEVKVGLERNSSVIVSFLCELYKRHWLRTKTVIECVRQLGFIAESHDLAAETLCQLLGSLGKSLFKRGNFEHKDEYMRVLNDAFSALERVADVFSDSCDRARFRAEDLLTLRRNHWTEKQGIAADSSHFARVMNDIKLSSDQTWFSSRAVFPLVIDFANEGAALQSLSDVKLVCGDKTFNCHRVILAQRSSTFQTMFTGGFAERSTPRVLIEDIPWEILQEILRFIYCGYVCEDVVKSTSEVQYGFLYAAVKYDLKPLIQRLTVALEENLRAANACCYLLFADRFGLDGLKEACFKLMTSNKNREVIICSSEWEEVCTNKDLVTALYCYESRK